MSSSSDHHESSVQYPEAIQVKLYQAFIFSIPILFSIILFLLFYLFYLKRRPPPPILPTTTTPAPSCDSDLKNDELKNKLCKILFDDECMKATSDSLCCVCLGEFEVLEELVQVVGCKHMFHIDCIHHWLHKNSTCPLCRAPVHLDYYNTNTNHHFHYKAPPHFHPPMLHLLHYTLTPSASSSATTTAAAS